MKNCVYFSKPLQSFTLIYRYDKMCVKGVKEMENNKIIITVSGADKVGIVAMVAQILADYKVNIEDIKQTLMQGHFVMFMLCDTSNLPVSLKEFKTALTDACSKLQMEVWVQKKAIFDNMHSI